MFFAFWRAQRTMPCLALWSGGVTLLGIGTLLITLRDAIPDLVSIVIANTLNVAGAIVVWNGIRLFNARQLQWMAALVAVPLLALSLAYWTYFENELATRIIIVSGTLAIISLVCAYELLRPVPRPLPRMTMVAGAPLVLNGIALAARAVVASMHAPTPSLMTAGAAALFVVPFVGDILTSFGLVMMTAERYIQQRCELEAQLFQSQKMEALGTLAGGVAHDLNNMLVPILVLAKTTAVRLPDGSRERRNLNTILQAGESARDLVSQILAFSRKEAPTLRRFDLAEVVRESLMLLRASLPSTIKIDERIGAVPLLLGDRSKLHQVIANLVTNAAQAIGDRHGTIIVELAAAPGERLPHAPQRAPSSALRLTVSDTGCGMDPRTAARMFDPFFTTKPAGAGTGLGLSVVHGIIDQHGGRIVVDSKVGRGTRFDIYLPADTSVPDGAYRDAVSAA